MLARRASITVDYQGVDITSEVNKDLLSFEYIDNASGENDTTSLSLKDDKKVWLKNWFPEKGDLLLPVIHTTNWRRDGDKQRLPAGRFLVDEPSYSGRPGVLSINAISSPSNSNFNNVDRSRTWRNITLKAIASDIAKRSGLGLQYNGNNNPRYGDKTQTETPDSSFLSELCEEEGLAMKVTDTNIVIFDERDFERKKSVAKYSESGGSVLGFDFRTSLSNTSFSGVKVKYYDSDLGRNIEFLYTPFDQDENSKIFQLNQRVKSRDEARRLAQRTLRRLNKKETKGTLKVIGNVELLGGVCIDLPDFGAFSGKYYIEKATHSIGSGFTTQLDIRKVLEGY